MRKTLATLTAIVAFGAIAGTASADDPNAVSSPSGYAGFSAGLSCHTNYKVGMLGQYGAAGYFIDGCTVRLSCPYSTAFIARVGYCDVKSSTSIMTRNVRGDHVTMNARVRRFDVYGNNYGWSDKSCSGLDRCDTADAAVISPGQSASVQCNGVREARLYDGNSAMDSCGVYLSYR